MVRQRGLSPKEERLLEQLKKDVATREKERCFEARLRNEDGPLPYKLRVEPCPLLPECKQGIPTCELFGECMIYPEVIGNRPKRLLDAEELAPSREIEGTQTHVNKQKNIDREKLSKGGMSPAMLEAVLEELTTSPEGRRSEAPQGGRANGVPGEGFNATEEEAKPSSVKLHNASGTQEGEEEPRSSSPSSEDTRSRVRSCDEWPEGRSWPRRVDAYEYAKHLRLEPGECLEYAKGSPVPAMVSLNTTSLQILLKSAVALSHRHYGRKGERIKIRDFDRLIEEAKLQKSLPL
jgi:hypothetical protein